METALPTTTEMMMPTEVISLANDYAARAMQLLLAERMQHDRTFERMKVKIRVAMLTSLAMVPGVKQAHTTLRAPPRSVEDVALVAAVMEAMMKSGDAVACVLEGFYVLRDSSVNHMKVLSAEVQCVWQSMLRGQAPVKADAEDAITQAEDIRTRALERMYEQIRAAKAFCHAMTPGIQAHATVVSSESKTLTELHSQLLFAIDAIEMEIPALHDLLAHQVQVLAMEIKRVHPAVQLCCVRNGDKP